MNPDETIRGSVERVTYHNEENGYCVVRLKSPGQKDLVTVVGHTASIAPGEDVECHGEWSSHRDFGLQFKAQTIRSIPPHTLEGIEKYLGSGMIKGIGPHFAKKLIDKFDTEVFEIIENQPEKLRAISGIGQSRIQMITSAWKDQKVIREIMIFLQSHGVSTSKSVRIFKTYGANAIQKVQENPYQLAKDINGIGFKSADIIAQNLGVSKTSMGRARAGILHTLFEQTSNGHCAYPQEKLLREAEELLEIQESILKEAIELEIQSNDLVRDQIFDGQHETTCLYPASLFRSESEVAKLLFLLSEDRVPWGSNDPERGIPWVEKTLNLRLAELQKEAVQRALTTKLLVITGGPGTGKTTLTRSIITLLKAKNIRILLCSPTGRAAKRLSECTGMEAKTIHRLLGFDPKKKGFLHDRDNPLPVDLLVIDESSMIDISLMYQLLKAVPLHAAVLIVGDVDQIPSVGPGNVLQSIIRSQAIPTVQLTQIFRQAAESQIIQTAHQINSGQVPILKKRDKTSDFHFIPSEDPVHTTEKIIELVKTRIPNAYGFDPIRDIQVLCPMNRGSLGGRALNAELQKALNPQAEVKLEKFGITFSSGDKVMVTANDYEKEVFNGDIGTIDSIDSEEREVTVNFEDRKVVFQYNEMDILTLAYAITIHKSQGSEYPAVVLPLAMQHYMMLKKNLIYTGITRGKKLVVVVGQEKALTLAIRSRKQDHRWSNLNARLQQAFN